MAKNYILEPVELTFSASNLGGAPIVSSRYENFNIEYDGNLSLLSVDVDNMTCKFASKMIEGIKTYYLFTPDGNFDEGSIPDEFVQVINNPAMSGEVEIPKCVDIGVGCNPPLIEGTHTVSIYTEEEEETTPSTGLPDMNVTYEFKNTAQNDIEDIIQAIYVSLDTSEPQNVSGYSPADRLVAAVAALHNVDVTTALTTGGYPNQMKRIAAIIRGDFA